MRGPRQVQADRGRCRSWGAGGGGVASRELPLENTAFGNSPEGEAEGTQACSPG